MFFVEHSGTDSLLTAILFSIEIWFLPAELEQVYHKINISSFVYVAGGVHPTLNGK